MLSFFTRNQRRGHDGSQAEVNKHTGTNTSTEGTSGIDNQLLADVPSDGNGDSSDHGLSDRGNTETEHPLFQHLARNRECTICFETMPLDEFPQRPITSTCTHPVSACSECIQASLLAQFEEKAMEHITCLECPELLTYSDVQAFVPPAKYRIYAEHAMNKTLSSIGQFVWCPLNGCESGQLHAPGARQPIVLCQACDGLSCFTHRAAWHGEHTCAEWDLYLADPTGGFRSLVQRERDREERHDAEMRALDRRIADAEHRLRQSVLGAEEAARARAAFAEARRREEARAAAELARERERKRREREEADRKRARHREMEEGAETVKKTSRPCPRCKHPTQRNGGW